MDAASPHSKPDWKLYLELGESLLSQESVAAQSSLIDQFIATHQRARAKFWGARPAYPLPAEPDMPLLPDARAPALVRKTAEKRTIQTRKSNPNTKAQVALPLIAQEVLLGVLLVERSAADPFIADDLNFLAGVANHAAVAMQTMRQISLKNWRFDQLALVRSVSARIANQRNLEELCRQVTGLIQETFDFYFVTIFTLDSSTGTLHFQASTGIPGQDLHESENFSIKVGDGIAGTVALTGQEIHAPDVSAEPLFRFSDALPETRAEVSIPLKVENRVLGVLDVQNDEARAIHEFDLSVLRTLADNIALAIEGAHLYTHLGKRATQLSAVLEISHAVTSTLDFNELLDVVVKSIRKHFNYEYIHIYSINPGRRKIIYEAGTGDRSQSFEDLQVTFNLDDPNGIIPWVAREGKTRLANDVSTEPLYRPAFLRPESTRAELAIPLEYAGQVLGVLDLQSERVNGFEVNDIPLLEAMSASIAIAIRNARLYNSEIWRRQVADSFREIAGLVSANVALDDLLGRILTQLDRNLPGKAAAIWLLEEDHTKGNSGQHNLRLAATRGVDADRLLALMEEDSTVRSLLSDIMDLEAPFIRSPQEPVGPMGRAMDYKSDYSSISAPLRAGDEPLGVLILAHPDAGCYGEEAGLISMTFANNAAVAIQNARLFTSAQEQAWISTILFKVAEAAQNSLSTDELLQTMARLTPLLIGIKKCAFFTWDENLLSFFMKSQYGLETPALENWVLGADIPVVEQMISTRLPVFVEDPIHELNLESLVLPKAGSTVVMLPLLSRGKLLGAFLAGHQSENGVSGSASFDQQTLSLLLGIAQQTAVAIENLALLEARQEEAYVTAVLLQVAQAVVSQNTLEDILDTIVHLMPILVGIDACAIYLWQSEDQGFQVAKTFNNKGHEDRYLEGRQYSLGRFPLLDAVREKDEFLASKVDDPDMPIEDWVNLTHLIPGDELNDQYVPGSNWVLAVPLSVKGEVFGVMLTAEANVPPSFHERRHEIINGIAQQVSLTIQNDQLNREMVERERLEKEIQLARQIQRTFLPSHLPDIKGWDLDIVWQTAREVGGDFYDIFKLGPDKLGIVIADVSDKGMPAALYMTVARTLIRAFVREIASPAKVLERVNRLLVVDSQDGLFVTAVYAVLNLREGTLTYANAGHNLPLIMHNNTRHIEPLLKGGMALGVMANSKIQEHTLEICPGDQLILYTDGVTESFSPAGEIFGEKRLAEALSNAPGGSPHETILHLNQVIREFRQGTPASDDLTLVVINRLQPENPI
ncbi:MAG: GAF domain-containing protein [Bellilinea sp.]